MRALCICCVLAWFAGQGCAEPAYPAAGMAPPAQPSAAPVEAPIDAPPADRTLVVQPVVAWEWTYRFEAFTVGGPSVKQTHGGVTLELAGSARIGKGTEDARVRVTYTVTRPKAVGELRFVTVDALSNGRTIATAGLRFGQTGTTITGRWDLRGSELPDRFTLEVTVQQPLLPSELIALQQARGPLIPGEVPYAAAQARLSDAVERVTGTRWAMSDSNAPTGELFSHPVYQFGIGGGPFPRDVQISRLTGEVLAVSGQIAERMQISGSDPVERIWNFVTQWCPDYPRERAIADDPPAVVYTWDEQGNRAYQYGWFIPDAENPSTGEHLTVETNTKGRPAAMYRLLNTTANRPSVSLDRAEQAATAFLRERGADKAGYAITEVARQYRGGAVFWREGGGRASGDAARWRFVRMLEFRPSDLTRETHWVWVDAHTGVVRDWQHFPTPTEAERARMMGPPETPPARPAPPPSAEGSRASFEALLPHGAGLPETPFEQVFTQAEAPKPPLDFAAFVSLIPVKPPLTPIERPFVDSQGTMAFTPLYPALPPGSRIARAIQIGVRDPNGNQVRNRTTRAVAVYYASPAEVLFFMATVPGLAPKLEQAKGFSVAAGISGTTGMLLGVPAARADFPNCTMVLLGNQAPSVLADRLRNASPGGIGSGGPLDGAGARSWILPAVTPGAKGPVLTEGSGAEQFVVRSLQRAGMEFIVEGRIPPSWMKQMEGRLAVSCWLIDAAGHLWRGRGGSWDGAGGAFEMTLEPTRAVPGEADPTPRMPLLFIVQGRGNTAAAARPAAELSYLPTAGREMRYEPAPHWHALLRLESLRVGSHGQRAAGAGVEYEVKEIVSARREGKTVIGVAFVERKTEMARRMSNQGGVTLVDDRGRRWPSAYLDARGLFKTQFSGGTFALSDGGWTFAVDKMPASFSVEIDLAGTMEARELAAVAWRNGGPIVPGERTVFELVDSARAILSALKMADAATARFYVRGAEATRTGQPVLEFYAGLEERRTVSVSVERRTGEVTAIYGSAGLFPAFTDTSAMLAERYRDVLFRPMDGVHFEELDHSAQEGHGRESPPSVMYRWQGRLADGRWTRDWVVVQVNQDGSLLAFRSERHQGPYPVVNLTAQQAQAAADAYLRGKQQYPSGVRGVTVTEEYVDASDEPSRDSMLGVIGGGPKRYVFTVRYDLGMRDHMGHQEPDFLDVYVDAATGTVLRAQGPGYR